MEETAAAVKYTEEFRKNLISIIKRSLKNEKLKDYEVVMLFHWVRNQDNPIYSFVPKRYRTLNKFKKES